MPSLKVSYAYAGSLDFVFDTNVPSGEKFTAVGTVPNVETLRDDPAVRVINGRGRTLMSGLGDAHTHFTWNGGDLDRLGDLGVEEHTLLTMRSAQCFLDSGYTM
jgi:cytosine/adenosine deaminase-related metal-dependent hydrolase